MVDAQLLRALWGYRGFVLGSVAREFQGRYLGSVLGAAWVVLNPLAMIIVYTVIFSEVMKARLAGVDSTFGYSIYLCAGILTWGLFAEMLSRLQSIFIDSGNLLKKVNFPRICLPTIVVLSAFVNFLIVFVLFLLFLLVSGNFPGWTLAAMMPVLLVQIVFTLGMGVLLGTLNVFFRDVGQLTGIVLQFWFWLTPIVYPANIVPEGLRALLAYNPMFPLVQAYQTILVRHAAPDWTSLWPVVALALLFSWGGLRLFRRRAGEMVDEL